jgi:hypothetical protein
MVEQLSAFEEEIYSLGLVHSLLEHLLGMETVFEHTA